MSNQSSNEWMQFKQQLLSEKTALQTQEIAFKDAEKPVELDQSKVGRLSRMDAMQAQQMALESSRRRQIKLLSIENALRRIESGEYGYCTICEEEVDVRRLAIDPACTHCINCAEKSENLV